MSTPINGSSKKQEQQRILYVGSDVDVLAVLRAVLKKPAFHIVSCPDRGSAILFINSDIRYDFFLFDLEMRDRAAFELAELAQSLDHRQQTPIVIAASEVDGTLEDLARNVGAAKCVSKKADMRKVSCAISRSLRERQVN